jgi:iron complex outermembrane recepter protein
VSHPFGRLVFAAALLFPGGLCVLAPAIAQTQEQVRTFDVPAQSLSSAILEYSRQSNVMIVVAPEVVAGKRSSEVKGSYTPSAALERLLEGTGLKAERRANGGLTLTQLAKTSEAFTSDRSDGIQKLESIRVTAQKREERLLDVPLSVAVVTREDIDRRGLFNSEDYLRSIPGVNQVDIGFGQSIVMRGMETSPRDQNFASGATTATYFGETPTTNSAGLGGGTSVDLKLVDIERVEVLRGPQGTAFGNSSMGGAVRTIPVAPRVDRFQGRVSAGYSSTSGYGGDNYDFQGVLNIPLLQDQAAVRGVAYRYQTSGFYRNRAGSDASFRSRVVTPYGAEAAARDQDDVGAYEVTGGRLAALLKASDDLRFSLNLLSQKTRTDGMPVATTGTFEQAMLQVAPEHIRRGQGGGLYDTDITIANPVVEYHFGWAQLVATYSSTRSGSFLSSADQVYGTALPLSSIIDSDHREKVGEVRLVTQLDGAFNFLAGLYSERLEDDFLFDYRWVGNPARGGILCAGCNQAFIGGQRQRWKLSQKAAFGEVSWTFLRNFTLTGGARSYDYDRTIAVNNDGPLFGGPSGATSTTDASGSTFRANLSYKMGNAALLYAGYSQGFRLGKPQPPLAAGRCDPNGDGIVDGTDISVASTGLVNSDEVDSYEVGGKLELLERRLSVEAAVFRMEWSDIPVRVAAGTRPQSCGLLYVANAGSALSEGVELQTRFQVTRAFRLDVGGSWIHARLTDGVPAQGFAAGARLPGSPKVNANLGLQYDFVIAGYSASLRADSTYVGAFYGDLRQTPNLKAGGYTKVDVSARVKVRNLNFDLFVRNLTDEDDFTFRGTSASVGEFHGYRLRPRTIGMQVGYTF